MQSNPENDVMSKNNLITIGKQEVKVFSAGKDPNKIIKKNY